LRPSGQLDLGHLYAGLGYSFGVGRSYVEGAADAYVDIGVGPSAVVGLRIPAGSIWFDVGLFVGPYSEREADYTTGMPDAEIEARTRPTGRGMPFGIEGRLVAPLKSPYVAFSFSLAPKFFLTKSGYIESVSTECVGARLCIERGGELRAIIGTAVRLGLSVFLGDWVELRLDVLGMELIFEKAFGVMYSPSFAIVLRI
jgi:hypothetical protein